MRKSAAIFAGILLLLTVCASGILAATFFFQGFETDTTGWFNFSNGSIIGVPSGYTNGGGYANGVSSSSGSFHSRLRINPTDPDNPTCSPGSSDCIGPFTQWGGYESVFPEPGYMTQVDIYLDVAFAATHPDYRFDWDSAINDFSGSFLRDFVFNVGTAHYGPAGFFVNASTNAFRNSSFPENPCPSPSDLQNGCRTPIEITTSGWYTFRHSFRDVGGSLAVEFTILDHSGNIVPGADWTIYSGDAISNVGGHRYGWFPNQEIRTSPSTTLSFARFRAQRSASAWDLRRWKETSKWSRAISSWLAMILLCRASILPLLCCSPTRWSPSEHSVSREAAEARSSYICRIASILTPLTIASGFRAAINTARSHTRVPLRFPTSARVGN
jgi:hypothetical protein